MNRSRRLVSLLVAFAVLATALWPLLGALHASASGEAMPLCHQAGMQVDASSAPLPAAPGDKFPASRSHCPLCVMVFIAAFGPVPAAPVYHALRVGDVPILEPAPLQRRFEISLPQGRAPPEASIAS
jgi:hypothetical protein